MNRRVGVLVLCVACLCPAAWGDLPAADTVIDGLGAVLRGMRDVTFDVEIHTGEKQVSGNIVLQCAGDDKRKEGEDAKAVRKYIVVTRVATPDGPAVVKQVNDGTFLWVERTFVDTGDVKVVRRRIDPEAPVPNGFDRDWRKETDSWRRNYSFRTLRMDTVDAEPVIVVEAVRKEADPDADAPKAADPATPGRMVLFISSRDYFPRKVELFTKPPAEGNRKDTPSMSVRMTHLKLNEGLKPGAFDYKVPPGAELVDVK